VMKRKQRYVVRPDEVVVTRNGEEAIIRYREDGISTTHLTIGPEIAEMSDADIVELFNDWLRVQAQRAAEYRHVAVEVPLGSPQVEYVPASDQWAPRGGVLRCQIGDDENGNFVVEIDDREFTLEEFGKMLVVYAGWGMRIEFVPDDAVHRRPAHEVRKPRDDGATDSR